MEKTELEYYIGVMSGTSLDGIDVALVKFDKQKCDLIAHHSHPIPNDLKESLHKITSGTELPIHLMGELDHRLGHLYADAILALINSPMVSIDRSEIKAIGNHGQTVYHHPEGKNRFTIQLGDANIIAARTGIDTIADFRRKDMAYGGQGAPLVPAFHKTLFASSESTCVILNIGGIANISVLAPDDNVSGYDTGPGNGLLDAWCKLHLQMDFDLDAHWASKGSIQQSLLNTLLNDAFFTKTGPKSSGREYFNLNWLNQRLTLNAQSFSAVDVQRTLVELTAHTIGTQIEHHRQGNNPQILVCGGGVHNPLLMRSLKNLLPHWTITTTDEQGINSDFMEAMAFAWLAQRRVHNLPSNLPSVTGASKAVSLGVIYPADN